MNDFNIKKCQKALKNIRKTDEKDLEIAMKKNAQIKSKTDSPYLYVKPSTKTHQKTKSSQALEEILPKNENIDTAKISNGINVNIPPILLKESHIKKENLLKPLHLVDMVKSEEFKTEEKKDLKKEMYEFLYGKKPCSPKKYNIF